MDFENIDIIDIHTHIDIEWDGIAIDFQMVFDMLIEDNLKYAIMITPDYKKNLEIARAHKDRVGLFLWYEPDKEDELIETAVNNLDVVKGIKFRPTLNGYQINYAGPGRVLDIAKEHNLIIATHTDKEVPSSLWTSLIERFSDVNFILYHGYPYDESIEMLKRYENTYVDTSFTALNKEYLRAVIEECGSRRILFGIDCPIGFPIVNGRYVSKYKGFFANELEGFIGNDEDSAHNILHRNAEKLLSI